MATVDFSEIKSIRLHLLSFTQPDPRPKELNYRMSWPVSVIGAWNLIIVCYLFFGAWQFLIPYD